jgi:hypothetical protein
MIDGRSKVFGADCRIDRIRGIFVGLEGGKTVRRGTSISRKLQGTNDAGYLKPIKNLRGRVVSRVVEVHCVQVPPLNRHNPVEESTGFVKVSDLRHCFGYIISADSQPSIS